MTVKIEVELRHPDAKIPSRSRESDAGYDLAALVDTEINPGQIVNLNTGMACVAPSGWYFTVEGRSGLSRHGIIPFRGIIDGGYTGDMIVTLINMSQNKYYILKGDRIAQLVPHRIVPMELCQVERVSESYNLRGHKGFGSSGR